MKTAIVLSDTHGNRERVAALLPLLFAQVAIKVLEFFRNDKKGGDTAP